MKEQRFRSDWRKEQGKEEEGGGVLFCFCFVVEMNLDKGQGNEMR